MSDKSKLSYYFTRKTEIPLQESSNTMLGLFVAMFHCATYLCID